MKFRNRQDKERYLRLLRAKLEYEQLYYEPNPKQLQFHQSEATRRFIQAGNQSGKTYCSTHEIAWIVTEMHPYKTNLKSTNKIVWVVGKSKRMVTDDLWGLYLQNFIPAKFIKKITKSSSYIENVLLTTGWEIRFKSYDQGRDALQGTPVDYILINEQPPNECFDEIEARVIQTGGTILMDFTPLNVDKKLKNYLEKNIAVETFKMSVFDNPSVNKEELREMIKAWPKSKIATRIYGEWFAYEGRLIPSYEEELHMIDDFVIPEHWRRCITIDPATSSDTGVIWLAQNPANGKWIIYREALLKELSPSKLIEAILNLNGYDKIESWFYDQQAAYLYREAILYNIYMIGVPKQGQNENMINELNQGFADKEISIFRSCTNTSEQIINYTNDPNTEEFKPLKVDDHLPDALKYFWRGRPIWNKPPEIKNRVQMAIERMHNRTGRKDVDPTMGRKY